jgi:hypothetical protein
MNKKSVKPFVILAAFVLLMLFSLSFGIAVDKITIRDSEIGGFNLDGNNIKNANKNFDGWVFNNPESNHAGHAFIFLRGFILCKGDANHDGVVNDADLQAVRLNFGKINQCGVIGDANGDCSVNSYDLSAVRRNLGNVCEDPNRLDLKMVNAKIKLNDNNKLIVEGDGSGYLFTNNVPTGVEFENVTYTYNKVKDKLIVQGSGDISFKAIFNNPIIDGL